MLQRANGCCMSVNPRNCHSPKRVTKICDRMLGGSRYHSWWAGYESGKNPSLATRIIYIPSSLSTLLCAQQLSVHPTVGRNLHKCFLEALPFYHLSTSPRQVTVWESDLGRFDCFVENTTPGLNPDVKLADRQRSLRIRGSLTINSRTDLLNPNWTRVCLWGEIHKIYKNLPHPLRGQSHRIGPLGFIKANQLLH